MESLQRQKENFEHFFNSFLTVKYKSQYHWEQKEQTQPFECTKDNRLSVRIWVIMQVSFKNIWMCLITICWLLFCTEMCQQTRSRFICVVSCCVCMCTELVSSSKKYSASTRSLLCSSQRFWLEMKSQLKHLGHSESSHIHTHPPKSLCSCCSVTKYCPSMQTSHCYSFQFHL